MTEHLTEVNSLSDIPEEIEGSPVDLLLRYHNLQKPFDSYSKAQLLIGMCMDNRKSLRIPANFAYIIRTGGANLRFNDFHVSYAIAIGGIRHIVLLAHNKCGMVNLAPKKKHFVDGLVSNGGWDRSSAEEHFTRDAPQCEIGNEIDFVLSEVKRLEFRNPAVVVVPLYYHLDNNKLYLISG
jgi:carbonic anhydrase